MFLCFYFFELLINMDDDGTALSYYDAYRLIFSQNLSEFDKFLSLAIFNFSQLWRKYIFLMPVSFFYPSFFSYFYSFSYIYSTTQKYFIIFIIQLLFIFISFNIPSLLLLHRQRIMSFFRSDEIEAFKLIMPRQSAWQTINLLGKFALVHIIQNKDIHLFSPFLAQYKRCDETLLKIKTIEKLTGQLGMGTTREFITDQELDDLATMWGIHEKSSGIQKSYLIEVQDEISNIWESLQKQKQTQQQLELRLNLYRQNLAIIEAGRKLFQDKFFSIKLKTEDKSDHVSVSSITDFEIKGVVIDDMRMLSSIKKTLVRISKGNIIMQDIPFKEIYQNLNQGQENKSVLFVTYPGQRGSILDRKIFKIFDTYCPNHDKYILPQTEQNFKQKNENLENLYLQVGTLLKMTQLEEKEQLKSLLGSVQGKNITQLQYYKFYLTKEKQIFKELTSMSTHLNFIEADVFIKAQDVEQVKELLFKIGTETKTPIATLVKQENNKLPTFFQLDDFKAPSQQITNTYGVPRYQEANPSYFTLITFPFLFGVMFGDIAHGLITFTVGLIILFSDPKNSSLIRMLYPFRYLITLMGFFATYCGFIYNDFLSISLNLFSSCYNVKAATPLSTIHKLNDNCVYPFGLDPVWSISTNSLNYVNSLKMKISVIIGVIHMTVGVFVKASNTIHFKNKIDFFFEFIPQLLFLLGLFGYMDFLIIFKWLKPWELYDKKAPSIITTMINLPLKMGKTDKCCGGQPMWGSPGETSQDTIQYVILIIIVLCIPLMLFPKPLIQIFGHKKKLQQNIEGQSHSPEELMRSNQLIDNSIIVKKPVKVQEVEASQLFVHQLIQTIEYVLGCVSNTASYLRLWALSLAHSQLSEVFFQKTVESGLAKGQAGIPLLIFAFPILAGATFGVLLCMDTMQCFLHTLRLHWVEFQSKFYKGDGFLFSPLHFRSRVKQSIGKI